MFKRRYRSQILEALVGNLRVEKRKLEAKVKNRDALIEELINQKEQLINENADLRHEKEDAIDTLKEIYSLATANAEVFNRKIKELAETAIKN